MNPTDWFALLSAGAAILSVFVAVAALRASKTAQEVANQTKGLDQIIELSLSRFKEDIKQQRLFADAEIVDLRLKGVDNSLSGIDHRTGRNTDHITILFAALLSSGIDIGKLRTRKPDWRDREPGESPT